MVISRRKRKENKEVSVYTNNKILEQIQSIKYLGTIIDTKLNFRDHIMHISSKCNKVIHALPKPAKQNWGLSQAALHTIYTGAILPLLLYRAPVWVGAIRRNVTKPFTTEYSAI